MKCKCGGNLRATHTFTEGNTVVRERKCDSCNTRETSIEFLVDRQSQGGAKAQLKRLRKENETIQGRK